MKILAAAILLASLLYWYPPEALATVEDGTILTNAQLAPLASWVSQQTHVTISSLPMTTASGLRLKTALGLHGVQQARAVSAYLPGQIVINNVMWDPESLRSQSYIVHELVHHAQLLSGRHYACHAAKEREAYTLQNQWLAEHGEDPIVSQQWIDELSSCSGSHANDEGE